MNTVEGYVAIAAVLAVVASVVFIIAICFGWEISFAAKHGETEVHFKTERPTQEDRSTPPRKGHEP